MKKIIVFATLLLGVTLTAGDLPAAGMSHEGHGKNQKAASQMQHEAHQKMQGAEKEMSHEGHGDMQKAPAGTFEHQMVVKNVRAEFQVMSLASMNMKDPGGATHHIMVKFFDSKMNHQVMDAAGRVKVVGVDKKEQVSDLKNYNGIFAGNFTFGEKGKYGVICLVKVKGEKHVFKFWYPHE